MSDFATSQTAPRAYVEPFGRDCLGNITGYRVYEGHGQRRTVAGQFCGDIYVRGSFELAHLRAGALADTLNFAA